MFSENQAFCYNPLYAWGWACSIISCIIVTAIDVDLLIIHLHPLIIITSMHGTCGITLNSIFFPMNHVPLISFLFMHAYCHAL